MRINCGVEEFVCAEEKRERERTGEPGELAIKVLIVTGGEDARGPHPPRNGQADWTVGFLWDSACQAILSDLSPTAGRAIKVLILCRCLSSPSLFFPWPSTRSATLGVQHNKTFHDTLQRSETCRPTLVLFHGYTCVLRGHQCVTRRCLGRRLSWYRIMFDQWKTRVTRMSSWTATIGYRCR